MENDARTCNIYNYRYNHTIRLQIAYTVQDKIHTCAQERKKKKKKLIVNSTQYYNTPADQPLS